MQPPLQTGDRPEIRQQMAALQTNVPWDKRTINGVIDLIDSEFGLLRTTLGPRIDAETAPFLFNSTQKDTLIALWLKQRAKRG